MTFFKGLKLSNQFIHSHLFNFLILNTRKQIIVVISLIFLFLLFFNGCIVTIMGDIDAPAPADASVVKLLSLALLAVYEVVVRVVPSVADYSAVSWVIGILKKISDTLNIRV